MTTPNQPLLRELIEIPQSMSDDDFVLKLAKGVSNAEETLREYVITDSLVDNFDQALGLIKAAVTGQASKAAYLHGSFGAGKSHFMAVLHALLRGEKVARERPEFAGLLAKHDWMDGRKFLLVPYHLMGAKSLEQRVFGHYIDYVRVLHPKAPIPQVHRTDGLLDQARAIRQEVGDAKFIAKLPGGDTVEEDEWGDRRGPWTSEKLDVGFAGAYDDKPRRRLVSDLLQSDWGKGFFRNAKEDAEAFVSLDAGLKEISRHAKELEYDGLILFLDELVLWLINSAGDSQLVSREMQKVTNFVESGDPDRPVPVVSFIARQRDLREALGEGASGAAELRILDTLDLAKARFDTVTLEDRNLPVIARERVLKPKNADAEAAIARAFDQTAKLRTQVWDTLLGSGGGTGADIESFRKTYPFSPAFMDTLVHLSAALQRSRTAIKLMRRLLIRRREELRLGQLIPLGDLYDVITEGGDEPFTQKLKVEFEAAQKLYETRLRPYLLDTYALSDDDLVRVHRGDAVDAQLAGRVRAFSGDDRLMKTLLLSALAPTVPALHNLTASRLSALNHGSVTSPIPGTEVAQVARKVETWASRFPEIKYVKADDPGVGLELVGVDVESVLSSARFADSDGARKNLIKKLLYKELLIAETGQYSGDRFDLTWRGSKRSVEVIFGNVRDEQELRDDAFHPADPTSWRVILDYPFDAGDHTPADDRVRVQGLISRGVHDRTVCWIPATLSAERMRDLRQLVVIDYVLLGQRFEEHAKELNPTDRHRARQTLTAQRDVLQGKLTETLRQAYGLTSKQSGDVVAGFDEHLFSLYEGLQPRLASGASLADAIRSLADQMLTAQYPAHPDFDPDRTGATVKLTEAKVVLEYVRRATEVTDGRIEVDKAHRAAMRRIANRLLLGEMHEAAFVLGSYWRQHFNQLAAQQSVTGDLSVTRLLDWIDLPEPRGLDKLLGHLVIACFAEQSDRAFVYQGGVLSTPPELNQIKDEMSLREERLPDPETWEMARHRAMEVFGHNPPEARRTRLATLFARQLSDDSRKYRDAAQQLAAQLEAHTQTLGLDPSAGKGRLDTAQTAADLLEGLGSRYGRLDIIEQLATADLRGPAQRVGKSIKSAAAVTDALRTAKWDALQHIALLPAPYDQEATRIFAQLREAAAADELAVGLGAALVKASTAAAELTRKANADAAQLLREQRAREAEAREAEARAREAESQAREAEARAREAQAREAQARTRDMGGTDPAGEPAGGGVQDPTIIVIPTDDRPSGATRTLPVTELASLAAEIARENPGATIEISWRVAE